MQKPALTIFYQYNPWNSTIGGIQTLINTFIKYAPFEWDLKLVGTGDEQTQRIGKWQTAELAGREISFLPIFFLKDDNVRSLIPTTLKYTAALLGKEFKSDFMHFHRLEPTIAASRWEGEKILFVHNDIQTQMQATGNKKAILWRRFPGAYFALENMLIRQFSQILSCNTDATQLYQQRYPDIAHRVTYVKNSFDNELFYPLGNEQQKIQRSKLAQQLGLDTETKFILFAGRLHPQKDPLLLIDAFAQLKEPKVHLLIAGDGELATEVSAAISNKGLSSQVTMLGTLSREKLAQWYRVASVFVLSSTYEGLPIAVLEALACGTPVVTTKCGETPKLLTTDSGVVSTQRTPECIADSLRQVLLHPENYPSAACVRTASPYAARTVVRNIYDEMFQRWQQRQLLTVR